MRADVNFFPTAITNSVPLSTNDVLLETENVSPREKVESYKKLSTRCTPTGKKSREVRYVFETVGTGVKVASCAIAANKRAAAAAYTDIIA